MPKDKAGNRLWRRVTVKVLFPDHVFKPTIFRSKAEARQGITEDGINDILMQAADRLETLYPFWEFEPVPLSPVGSTARYVFKFAGYSKKQSVPAQVDMKDFVLPMMEEVKE